MWLYIGTVLIVVVLAFHALISYTSKTRYLPVLATS